MKIRITLCILLFCLFLSISACSQAQTLSNEESDQIFEFANPIADNLLTGLNTGDYETFSRDFDETMKAGISETAFFEMKQSFDEKLGAYEFLQQDTASKDNGYIVTIYVVQFEKAPTVTMRLVLTDDDAHKVSGLWFDSPELRK